MRRPCKTCPYRKTTTAADIPGGFDVAHYLLTFPSDGGGAAQGVCHYAPEDNSRDAELRCVGWLYDQRVRGTPSLPLRLALNASHAKAGMGSDLVQDFMGAGEHPDDVGQLREGHEVLVEMLGDPGATNRAKANAIMKAHANLKAQWHRIEAQHHTPRSRALVVQGDDVNHITMPHPSEPHYADAVALVAELRRPARHMTVAEVERLARVAAEPIVDDGSDWFDPIYTMGAGRIAAEAARQESEALEHCESAAGCTLAFTQDMTINCAARAFARAAALRAEYARRLAAMRAKEGQMGLAL